MENIREHCGGLGPSVLSAVLGKFRAAAYTQTESVSELELALGVPNRSRCYFCGFTTTLVSYVNQILDKYGELRNKHWSRRECRVYGTLVASRCFTKDKLFGAVGSGMMFGTAGLPSCV